MSGKAQCSQCGKPLPPDAPRGTCPECLIGLLGSGFQDEPTQVCPARAEAEPLDSSPALAVDRPFGDYLLLEEIARGGMGVVYKARQVQLNRIVALKMILAGQFASKQIAQRFKSEAGAAAILQHPNIVAVHDVGVEDGQHFFSMEYVEGQNLSQLVGNRPLHAQKAARYVKLIAEAIHYAHGQSILHRDLKPSNVLIDAASDQPRVTDFGLAKRLDGESSITMTGQVLGSPNFMPPEQASGSRGKVGKPSDVYGLGAILFYTLTARAPFQGATLETTIHEVLNVEPLSPRLLNPSVPRDLETICLKCLEKEPAKRYATAHELADELGRFLRDEPIHARPVRTPEKLWRWCRRKPALASFAAATVLLLLAVTIGAPIAAVRIARERATAEQRLYDSLVREARATRGARHLGYREEVIKLIRQARSLDVPNKNLSELRREAISCLGDFVGLTPTTFTDFPTNTTIRFTRLDPTGRLAAFVLSDGTILLRELPSGKAVARLRGDHPPRCLCFSDGGDRLISLGRPDVSTIREQLAGSVVHVWRRRPDGSWEETEKRVIPGAYDCFSAAQGVYVATVDLTSKTGQLIDLRTRDMLHRFDTPNILKPLPVIALSPDGRFFAMETAEPNEPGDSRLEVWDLTNGKPLKPLEPRLTQAFGVTFSDDGRHLARLSHSGAVIYSTDRFERVVEFRDYFLSPSRISFAPNRSVVSLPITHLNRVRLFDLSRYEDIASLVEPATAGEAAFTSDENFLLTSGRRHARLYRLNLATEKLSLRGHPDGVPAVAFSPDGTRLASVSKDRTVKVSDAATGRVIWENASLPGLGQGLAYSPDGRWLATTFWETPVIWLWDAERGKKLLELGTNAPTGHAEAQFTSDGRYLIATSSGVKVWALKHESTGTPDARVGATLVNSLDGPFLNLVLSPDNRHLAFARSSRALVRGDAATGWFHELCVWDFLASAPPRSIATNASLSVQMLAFTPDGTRLLKTDKDWNIVTFDVASGREVSAFKAANLSASELKEAKSPQQYGEVGYLSLSPDGAKLALSSRSALGVDLWDPKTGRLLYSLPEQPHGSVWWLAWSPDNERLAVSRSNGDVTIWNLSEVERVLAGLGLDP